MNWSLIILGLVALSGVTYAANSYLVIVPNLFKIGHDNQVSVFIAAASKPVEIKFMLTVGQHRVETKTIFKTGETRNATLALPKEFPVGAGELIITGTGGLQFEERRDVIVYDNRHVMLVQTSASTYRPRDTMEIRVVATHENLMPIEQGELIVEVYDAALKLVGEFPRVAIQSGLTETLFFPIGEHVNVGTWLVSATIGNTTSSVEVLVSRPITPSFDLKAIFQRYLLRTDKTLHGVIEINNDENQPIFGRGTIAIGQITEQQVELNMKTPPKEEKPMKDEWKQWKSQQIEIAGRMELNYDLLSLFNIDVSKILAVQIHIQVTDLLSGQERIIHHIVPVFTRDVVYDIRPLEFQAGTKNEFEIIAKRPDGKPTKMEDMIVTVRMIMGNEQGKPQEEKSIEITDFYTRGRNDIGFFVLEVPENCIGVLMTITPLDESGKVRGYRTHAIPLMPTPRRHGAKLTIELLPSTVAPTNTNVNVPVVSSQISTVGRTSNFYIQLIPSKPVEKFERLPMSYVLMTNGRITLTGEFHIEPTKECQTKTVRTIHTEQPMQPACVFNGTLPIEITRDMIPYSSLLVYTFQPTFGFNVAESYRFAVAGLFQSSLTLNATIVPFTSTETYIDYPEFMKQINVKPVHISNKVQDKTRVELSFTGVPDSTVGLNVIEYDGILQGLSNDITKERVLKYLINYEQVPITSMPTMPQGSQPTEQPLSGRQERQFPEDTQGQGLRVGGPTSVLGGQGQGPMVGGQGPMVGGQGPMVGGQGQEQGQGPMVGEQGQGPMVGEQGQGPMVGGQGQEQEQGSIQARRTISEQDEEEQMNRAEMGFEIRYPVEKLVLGISSSNTLPPVEGDDIYTPSLLGQLYGDMPNSRPSHYRRKVQKSIGQSSVTVGNNDYVVATSVPLVLTVEPSSKPIPPPQKEQQEPSEEKQPKHGTPEWYKKMNSKLNSFSQEAFTFMQSGLTYVSDFESLRIPMNIKHEKVTQLFGKFRQQSLLNGELFSRRDEARELLEEYVLQSDASLVPPPIMLEEQSRVGYYRSVFFNTSRIESQGTGKVVLPRTKPYSTWLATGFALNTKSGLSIAQPIRLPTNQGLYVLANFPKQVQMGEQVLLTYGINNYLGKDLKNVVLRIRGSNDFDLMEQGKPEQIVSTNGKDYTFTIPSLKSFAVETRHMIVVPKRMGFLQIVIEVESEFGGDYEVITVFARESGIERVQMSGRLFDLTSDKKSYGPIIEKVNQTSDLRAVYLTVSGTGLDHFVRQYTMETNTLLGIDRALIRLYRSIGLRHYLNETSQTFSPLYNMTADNITTAYQRLQLYNEYDGAYSFVSDEGTRYSSLYLTSLAFGAMISPIMPLRDNVTLNRTLTWILSHQQEDGSFDDNGPCFHYRFCAGEFRRESLTAIVLYSLTRYNASLHMPEFIHSRLYHGENSPLMRAQRYLESRVEAVKPNLLVITLFEMAFIQCPKLSPVLREKIHQTVLSRKLTLVPEDGSKYIKNTDLTFDDQLLVNSMTVSLYTYFGDYKTATEMSNWVVAQLITHPYYDGILDAIFHTEAWLGVECLFRKQFSVEKFDITVDVTTDSGEKREFKINSKTMDLTQVFPFTLPVRQVTYSVKGFGIAGILFYHVYGEQQQQTQQPLPYQLTHEFTPMPWLNEVKAKTCVTYTPTPDEQKLATGNFNRTIVVKMELPSGTRVNLRQLGFFLSNVREVIYFTYEPCGNQLSFFINVPTTVFGKPICLEWCLERLSSVMKWSPIEVRVYDYLQPESHLVRLIPIEFQPNLIGYSFVDAVHKARPTLETLANAQKPKHV